MNFDQPRAERIDTVANTIAHGARPRLWVNHHEVGVITNLTKQEDGSYEYTAGKIVHRAREDAELIVVSYG